MVKKRISFTNIDKLICLCETPLLFYTKIKGVINMVEKKTTPFEAVGEKTLQRIIDTFYGLVAKDPNLAPIFPDDLSEIARKQKQFLTQYLGGPALYTEEHGHPMMKSRHSPFPITPTRAKSWLSCMNEAMEKVGLKGSVRDEFYSRLVMTAQYMINTPDDEEKFQGEKS
jgi:hemoglobin